MPLLVPVVCVKHIKWALHAKCAGNYTHSTAHVRITTRAGARQKHTYTCVHVRARVYVLVSICAVFCALEDGRVARVCVRFRVLCVRAGRTCYAEAQEHTELASCAASPR